MGRGVWGGLFPKPTPDWIRLLGKGCVCSPSPGTYQLCLSPPAGPAFAFGAGRRALRQSVGVLLQGERCGMGASVALPTRRAWLFLQKAALGPHQRPCLRPHRSSSSPKCPSPCPRRRWVRRCSSWTSQRLPPCRSGPRGAIAPAPQFPHPRGLPCDTRLPPAHQAPSAFPAELRPPKFCQEQADKPPWQDANGHLERDGSRGEQGDPAAWHRLIPSWGRRGRPPLIPSRRHLRLLPQSRGPAGADGGGDAEAVPR